MIARFLRWFGWRKLINFFLLLIVLGTLGYGLSTVVRGFDRTTIASITLIGIISVMLLNQSNLNERWAVFGLGFAGLAGSIYHFAGLTNPLVVIVRALESIPNTLLQARTWPELSSLAFAWYQLVGQFNALLTRIVGWFATLIQGELMVDPLVTNFLWGFAIWMITIWAAWGIFRMRQPLLAVVPAGILLASTLNYSRGNPILLVPIVASTLLLMALGRYEVEEQYWQRNLIDYAEDIRLDMLIIIPLLVIGLITLATFTPSFSIRQVVQLIQELIEPRQSQVDSIAESLGLNQPPPITAEIEESLRSPGLPQHHLLGAGPELSQQVVMVIQTGDLPPLSSLEVLPHPPAQYYWRSLTYDIYTGRGWTTSPTEIIQYSAGESAVTDLPENNPAIRTVNQVVQIAEESSGVLFATGMLITADAEYEVAWREPLTVAADSFGVVTQAARYSAISQLVTPSLDQLRTAHPIYPEWIQTRYLKLPASLPQRVTDLALDLTRSQLNSYDQAAAIEAYLRGFPYSLNVPAPPPDQDVSDFFLFDLQEGYCDYYATAMVVLSRAAGLPARLVSGYATGFYDPPNARYVITAANAHSWVEIYFSGIGWVEFEPTGGLPAIERHQSQVMLPQVIPEPKPVQRFNIWSWLKEISWLTGLLVFLGVGLAVCILWYNLEIWRLRRLTPHRAVARIYQRLRERGELLDVKPRTGDTPIEYASRLGISFNRLARKKKEKSFYWPAAGEIDQLIALYNQSTFSPHPVTVSQHLQAIRIWLRLRWRLLAARIKHTNMGN